MSGVSSGEHVSIGCRPKADSSCAMIHMEKWQLRPAS